MKTKLAVLLLILAGMGRSLFGQTVVPIVNGTVTVDASAVGTGRPASFKVVVSATIASVSIINGSGGQPISILFIENATGGFGVTFASNIINPCTVTTTANAPTGCSFTYDGGNNQWVGTGGSSSGGGAPGQTQVNNNGPLGGTPCQTFTNLATGPINYNCIGVQNQDQYPATGAPYWDVKAFGASGSNQSTTGSINSGQATLTLAAAKDFQNGQNVNVFAAGPTSSALAPTGCTVTPVGVPGATTYNYQVSARDNLGGLSAATTVITTSTGNASLGPQLLTIAASGFVRTAGVVTITLTTSPSIPSGTIVDVYGTGDLSSNGRFTTSGGTANTITYNQKQGNSYQPDLTRSGGTVRVMNYNQLVCTGQSTGATGYIVWGRTGGSLTAVGGMSVETVTGQNPTFKDFGHSSTVPPDMLSVNPPGSPTAQDLVATIVSGGGTTTLTLNASAGNTVVAKKVQHSDTAAINAALAAAASETRTTFGGGGVVNFPMGSYNFEILTFPTTTPNAAKWMVLQMAGEFFPMQPIAFDTGQGPYKFVGIAGTGNAAFGKAPVAAIGNTGVLPQLQITGSSGNPTIIQGLNFSTFAGDAIHVYGNAALAPSNTQFVDVQVSIGNTANYGSSIRRVGGGFGLHLTGGAFTGSDDAPAVYTDAGQTTIQGTISGPLQLSSIECVTCGGTLILYDILQESGTRPFLNIFTPGFTVNDITLDKVSIADTSVPGAVPMVNIMNGGLGVSALKIWGYNQNGADVAISGVPPIMSIVTPAGSSASTGLANIGQYVNSFAQDLSGSIWANANGQFTPPIVVQQAQIINQNSIEIRNSLGTVLAGIGRFGEGIFHADNTSSTFGIQITGGGSQITKTDKFSNWFVRSELCPASFPLAISQACGSGSTTTFAMGSAAGYTGSYLAAFAVNNISTKVFNLSNIGNTSARSHYADLGTTCTNGELALSAGWQSTGAATVTAVAGIGQTCSWTITTGTTTAANPTVTDTLVDALPNAGIVCELNIHGGSHTPVAGEYFQQTTLSSTAPIFTFQGTPTAGGTTYFVTRRCGP